MHRASDRGLSCQEIDSFIHQAGGYSAFDICNGTNTVCNIQRVKCAQHTKKCDISLQTVSVGTVHEVQEVTITLPTPVIHCQLPHDFVQLTASLLLKTKRQVAHDWLKTDPCENKTLKSCKQCKYDCWIFVFCVHENGLKWKQKKKKKMPAQEELPMGFSSHPHLPSQPCTIFAKTSLVVLWHTHNDSIFS